MNAFSAIYSYFHPKNIFTGEAEFQFLPASVEKSYGKRAKEELQKEVVKGHESTQRNRERIDKIVTKLSKTLNDLCSHAQREDRQFDYQAFLKPATRPYATYPKKSKIDIYSRPGGGIY